MKPAWLIDEYASMRFTSVCTTARTEPTTRVNTARTTTTGRQSSDRLDNATVNTRKSATKAAVLPTEPMSAVTGVGAPWYTSAVQVWNGTSDTLKPKPTSSNAIPASNIADEPPRTVSLERLAAIFSTLVEPVAPNTNATPYRKKADAKPPSTKYFRPASPLAERPRLLAVNR